MDPPRPQDPGKVLDLVNTLRRGGMTLEDIDSAKIRHVRNMKKIRAREENERHRQRMNEIRTQEEAELEEWHRLMWAAVQ